MPRRRALPFSTAPAPTGALTTCPFHPGQRLEPDGFCPPGQGYPLGVLRQESCPYCRGALEWDGGCLRCHGCGTGERGDWSFPGARYDRYDDHGQPIGDGQHWVLTDPTRDRPVSSRSDADTRLAAIQRILAAAPAKGWKRGR